MNRSFYSFAIVLIALYIFILLCQSLLFFALGSEAYFLQSFPYWFIGVSSIAFIWSALMLKYYYYKLYWFAFFTLIISVTTAICQVIMFYIVLTTRQRTDYDFVIQLAVLTTSILYATSLIFSKAGERPWLRTAGICLFILELIVLSGLIWMMTSNDNGIRIKIQKIHQLAGLIASLVPFLFVLNFLQERAKAEKENENRREYLHGILAFIPFLIFVPMLVLGLFIISQSSNWIGSEKKDIESAKSLAILFEERSFVNSKGEKLLYRLLKPLDYDSTKEYPLVVILHHGGVHGNDNVRQVTSEPARLLSTRINRNKYPAFLFVPQSPKGSHFGGHPNMPSVDFLVFEAISALEKEFKIDTTRRYVAGSSGGGYGTWHFICTHPEMFAAALPISGGNDPKLAKKIINVPVWVFNGEKDKSVPVKFARDMVKAIRKEGGNPRYTEFAGTGHYIWDKIERTPGVMDWLFAQKRK